MDVFPSMIMKPSTAELEVLFRGVIVERLFGFSCLFAHSSIIFAWNKISTCTLYSYLKRDENFLAFCFSTMVVSYHWSLRVQLLVVKRALLLCPNPSWGHCWHICSHRCDQPYSAYSDTKKTWGCALESTQSRRGTLTSRLHLDKIKSQPWYFWRLLRDCLKRSSGSFLIVQLRRYVLQCNCLRNFWVYPLRPIIID